MFENLAAAMSKAMITLSQGELNCLPYCRSLLDFCDIRGKAARPLVVRCVVFGSGKPQVKWWTQRTLSQALPEVLAADHAVGEMSVQFYEEGKTTAQAVAVRYIKLGYPGLKDQDKTLGNFHGGQWLGHLVVVCEKTLIDLTIGQVNSSKLSINLNPPHLTFEAKEEFLAGTALFVHSFCGSVIVYQAYPDERTYEKSGSWTDQTFRRQLRQVAESVAKAFEGKPDQDLHQPERVPDTNGK